MHWYCFQNRLCPEVAGRRPIQRVSVRARDCGRATRLLVGRGMWSCNRMPAQPDRTRCVPTTGGRGGLDRCVLGFRARVRIGVVRGVPSIGPSFGWRYLVASTLAAIVWTGAEASADSTAREGTLLHARLDGAPSIARQDDERLLIGDLSIEGHAEIDDFLTIGAGYSVGMAPSVREWSGWARATVGGRWGCHGIGLTPGMLHQSVSNSTGDFRYVAAVFGLSGQLGCPDHHHVRLTMGYVFGRPESLTGTPLAFDFDLYLQWYRRARRAHGLNLSLEGHPGSWFFGRLSAVFGFEIRGGAWMGLSVGLAGIVPGDLLRAGVGPLVGLHFRLAKPETRVPRDPPGVRESQ